MTATSEITLPAKMREALIRKAVACGKQAEQAFTEHLKAASQKFTDEIVSPASFRPGEYQETMQKAGAQFMLQNITLFADMEPFIDECVAHMQSQIEGEDAEKFREWVDLKFPGHALNAPTNFMDAMLSACFTPARSTALEPTVEAFGEAVKAEVDSFAAFKLRQN